MSYFLHFLAPSKHISNLEPKKTYQIKSNHFILFIFIFYLFFSLKWPFYPRLVIFGWFFGCVLEEAVLVSLVSFDITLMSVSEEGEAVSFRASEAQNNLRRILESCSKVRSIFLPLNFCFLFFLFTVIFFGTERRYVCMILMFK